MVPSRKLNDFLLGKYSVSLKKKLYRAIAFVARKQKKKAKERKVHNSRKLVNFNLTLKHRKNWKKNYGKLCCVLLKLNFFIISVFEAAKFTKKTAVTCRNFEVSDREEKSREASDITKSAETCITEAELSFPKRPKQHQQVFRTAITINTGRKLSKTKG